MDRWGYALVSATRMEGRMGKKTTSGRAKWWYELWSIRIASKKRHILRSSSFAVRRQAPSAEGGRKRNKSMEKVIVI